MIARVLALALLVAGCSKSRVTVADAAAEASSELAPADAGSEKAIVDAGPRRPPPDSLAWRTTSKTLAYLRNDDLYILDSDTFTRRMQTRIPHVSYATISPLNRGGALIFGTDGDHVDAQQKVVLVDPTGAFKAVEMGGQISIEMEVAEAHGHASAIIDEEAGTFARFVIQRPADTGKFEGILLEVRALGDGSVKSKTPMPAWFRGRMDAPPRPLGCRGTFCAFAVAPLGQPAWDDDTLLLAVFDLRERAPKLLSNVVLGPAPDVAFGKGNMFAVTFGAGADPVLLDSKTLAVRALGHRGGKVDAMNAAACIAFSSDGALLISTSEHDGLSVFDTATGKRRWKTASVAHWRSCGTQFGPDGHVLDYSSLGNMQKLDVASGKRLNDFARARMHNSGHPVAVGNESWLTRGAISPKGSFLVLHDRETSKMVLLDTTSWGETPLQDDGLFDPEDRYFVVGDIVYDAATQQPKATLF